MVFAWLLSRSFSVCSMIENNLCHREKLLTCGSCERMKLTFRYCSQGEMLHYNLFVCLFQFMELGQ